MAMPPLRADRSTLSIILTLALGGCMTDDARLDQDEEGSSGEGGMRFTRGRDPR
jgi:hypothetical protein